MRNKSIKVSSYPENRVVSGLKNGSIYGMFEFYWIRVIGVKNVFSHDHSKMEEKTALRPAYCSALVNDAKHVHIT